MKRTNVWIPRGKGRWWGELGVWGNIYTVLCIKWIADENLLCSTGNSSQCSAVTECGGNPKKEGVYV